MPPDGRAVLRDDGGGEKLVPFAAQAQQSLPRARPCRRFVQSLALEIEDLVGAEDQRAGQAGGNAARLHLCQRVGLIAGEDPFGAHRELHFLFIHARSDALDLNPRIAEHVGAPWAGGRENQRHRSWPFSRRMARISAAVSSIDRLVTSITGAPRLSNSRRASATSFRIWSSAA